MNLTKLLTKCRIFILISYCVIYSYCAQYNFTTQPHSVLVAEGEEASLTCAWKPPLSDDHIVRWYHWPEYGDVFEITTSDTKYVLTDTSSSEQGISHLTIKSVGYITGSGQYRCEIRDPRNIPRISNFVSVGTIKCLPENYNGEIGEPVVCSTSISDIDLRWYNKTKLIDTARNVHITYYLDLEDDGVSFTCKARSRGPESTEIGTCETTPLVLRIDAKIEKSPPGPLQVGDNFNLTCLTRGDPKNYEYRWKIDNKLLDSSKDYEDKRYGIGEKRRRQKKRNVKSNKCLSLEERTYEEIKESIIADKNSVNYPTTVASRLPAEANEVEYNNYPTLQNVDITGTKAPGNNEDAIEYDYVTLPQTDATSDINAEYDDVALPPSTKNELKKEKGNKSWSVSGLANEICNKKKLKESIKTTVELNPLYGQI